MSARNLDDSLDLRTPGAQGCGDRLDVGMVDVAGGLDLVGHSSEVNDRIHGSFFVEEQFVSRIPADVFHRVD